MAEMSMEPAPDPTAETAVRPAPSPVRRGRPEAAAAIWRWRDDAKTPARRDPRIGGAARCAIGGAIGALLFVLGRTEVAIVAWSLSGLVFLIALLSPTTAYPALLRGLSAAGRAVGLVLTWLLLGPLYLIFFTTFRLLFRRGARDSLARRIEPDAPSYWKPRDPDTQVRSLEKPY